MYGSEDDPSPMLIMWFFDSRGSQKTFVCGCVLSSILGGFRKNETQLPDWVDSSVAEWIASETKEMDRVWGPGDNRAALAFVHIPP